MKQTIATFVAVYALVIGATSCNTSSIATPTINSLATTSPTTSYTQIERLARPAVKEALQSYDRHELTARANPYNDPALPADILAFMSAIGRSTQTATTLQSVLIPDELAFDLSQLGAGSKAAYLGVETAGFTGSKFGGRALTDDVIDIDLGAIFGPTLAKLSAAGILPAGSVPDDNKEIPCLTTDNVGPSTQSQPAATFPYLNSPN